MSTTSGGRKRSFMSRLLYFFFHLLTFLYLFHRDVVDLYDLFCNIDVALPPSATWAKERELLWPNSTNACPGPTLGKTEERREKREERRENSPPSFLSPGKHLPDS